MITEIAYITVGNDYAVEQYVRPRVAGGSAHWYHFDYWNPVELEFTISDLKENYKKIIEVYNDGDDNINEYIL